VRGRRWIVILTGAVAALAAAFVYFLSSPCSEFVPSHDSASMISMEQHELLRASTSIYEKLRRSPYSSDPSVPKPLKAKVSGGRNAVLAVAGPIASNALIYAQAWYDVYRRSHGGTCTVSLHVVWKSGARTQTFPVSDL
jgi:hypothetical protein